MTSTQMIIKYLAIAFACLLVVAIITGVIGVVASLSGFLGLKEDDGILSEMTMTNFESSEIDTLNIEISASELTIKKSDSLKVETNNKYIEFNQQNKKLEIKEKKHKWVSIKKGPKLIVYIPENIEFKNIKISTGAGEVNIEELKTESLVFELGAGEVEIESLNVTKNCEFNGGAGQLSILSGNINNLSLDMGVGETNLDVTLIGKNDINAGVGSLNVNLQNSKENYTIQAEKGLGTIRIDGEKISDGQIYGNGSNLIDINGGVGDIKVTFE